MRAAERLRDAWREHDEIVSAYLETYPDPVHQTVMDIVGNAQGRYAQAAKDVLRPALDAPTTTAAVAELYGLDARPATPALREAAEALRARHNALCRWLTAQGHDLDPLGELPDEDETSPGGMAAHASAQAAGHRVTPASWPDSLCGFGERLVKDESDRY
jgi:hypothetical protein